MAEYILKNKIKHKQLNWHIASAGVENYHIGEGAYPIALKVAASYNIDMQSHRASHFTQNDFDKYDKIYAFADDVYHRIIAQIRNEKDKLKVDYFLNEANPSSNASVTDPWYHDEDMYHAVFQQIDEVCDIILEKYKD